MSRFKRGCAGFMVAVFSTVSMPRRFIFTKRYAMGTWPWPDVNPSGFGSSQHRPTKITSRLRFGKRSATMPFSEIIGHDYPKSLLGRLLQTCLSGRQAGLLPHAYLFEGPDGIGKRRMALEFAKALNCERSGRNGFNDACDECPAC